MDPAQAHDSFLCVWCACACTSLSLRACFVYLARSCTYASPTVPFILAAPIRRDVGPHLGEWVQRVLYSSSRPERCACWQPRCGPRRGHVSMVCCLITRWLSGRDAETARRNDLGQGEGAARSCLQSCPHPMPTPLQPAAPAQRSNGCAHRSVRYRPGNIFQRRSPQDFGRSCARSCPD